MNGLAVTRTLKHGHCRNMIVMKTLMLGFLSWKKLKVHLSPKNVFRLINSMYVQ